MIKVGDVIQNRYTIVRPLGSGGFGAVFLATDSRLGNRNVAIKYFATSHMRPEEADISSKLFQSEAHTLARLNHPNLAPVLDYFEVEGGWILIMGYVPGESLATLQKRLNGPFGEHQVVEWAIELCNVLEYLHRQQPPLVFRDLKPSNIMRTPEGKVMLIDFGIMRTFKEGQHQDTVQLGTPGYAPPEQYGGQTEPRSDIYALGATMFVLLTNERLTSGLRIPPVRDHADWVSPALNTLIQHMTELRPQERPASMAAVRAELEKIKANPYVTNDLPADPFANVPQAANPYRSTPDAATVVNPNLVRPNANQTSQPYQSVTPQPQYQQPVTPQPQYNQPSQPFPAQPQYQQPAYAPAQPAARSKAWLWGLLALLVIGGITAFLLRDQLFGGGGSASNPTDVPANVPDSLEKGLVITGRNSDSGPYDIFILDAGGVARKIIPNHDDNAIASRRGDGKLVYTHGVNNIEQIFVVNADGSAEQQLTKEPGINRAPRWSPDGNRIAFESTRDQSADNQRDIYIMNADGSNVQRITAEAGWQGGPAWSPDGTKLVFHSRVNNRYEIVLLELASNRQFTLAADPNIDFFWPDWSPDGKTVAFMSEDSTATQTAIYTIPANGGAFKKLDNLGAGRNRWPRWSPDGRYLSFESFREGRWQIYVQTLADGKVRKISDGSRNERWAGW